MTDLGKLKRLDARNIVWLALRRYSGYLIVDEQGNPFQAVYRCEFRAWDDGLNNGFDNLVCWLRPELPSAEMTAWFNIVRKANAHD